MFVCKVLNTAYFVMYLIRVLSFIGDVRFNVRGEHVAGCLGRGSGRGLGGYQPGVYVPLKALFLVFFTGKGFHGLINYYHTL